MKIEDEGIDFILSVTIYVILISLFLGIAGVFQHKMVRVYEYPLHSGIYHFIDYQKYHIRPILITNNKVETFSK